MTELFSEIKDENFFKKMYKNETKFLVHVAATRVGSSCVDRVVSRRRGRVVQVFSRAVPF